MRVGFSLDGWLSTTIRQVHPSYARNMQVMHWRCTSSMPKASGLLIARKHAVSMPSSAHAQELSGNDGTASRPIWKECGQLSLIPGTLDLCRNDY